MEQVISTNNSGVASLATGSYKEALISFKRAAEMMHSCGRMFSIGSSGLEKSNVAQEAIGEGQMAHSHSREEKDDNKWQESEENGQRQQQNEQLPFIKNAYYPKEVCFLRSKAFVIAHRASSCFTCTQVSAIILFNMALTYQLSFLKSTPLPRSIDNAASLYGMAISLATHLRDQPLFVRLLLASLNNLGYLHYDVGNFQLSKVYFYELIHSAARAVEQAGDKALTAEVLAERQQVLLNAMVLDTPHSAKAA